MFVYLVSLRCTSDNPKVYLWVCPWRCFQRQLTMEEKLHAISYARSQLKWKGKGNKGRPSVSASRQPWGELLYIQQPLPQWTIPFKTVNRINLSSLHCLCQGFHHSNKKINTTICPLVILGFSKLKTPISLMFQIFLAIHLSSFSFGLGSKGQNYTFLSTAAWKPS